MQITFAAPAVIKAGSWVVGATDGGALLPAALAADKASGGALTRALKSSSFTGKAGWTADAYTAIAKDPQFWKSVGLSLTLAAATTALSLLLHPEHCETTPVMYPFMVF